MIGTIIITILIVILVQVLFLKLTAPIFRRIIDNAIEVACYVDTYHYTKDKSKRIEIGQDRYYESIFKDKKSQYKRSLTDYVFYIFYTQLINKPLECIPIDVNRYNNRVLSEGEQRKSGIFLDRYQNDLEDEYLKYATPAEIQNRIDINSAESEEENNK